MVRLPIAFSTVRDEQFLLLTRTARMESGLLCVWVKF
jgi:hypothetical protein